MPTAFLSHPFLTEDHRLLLEQAEALTDTRIAPLTAEMEARGPHTDQQVREVLSETGWLGMLISAEYDGGLDLGHVDKTLILQILSRKSPAAGAILQASVLGAAPIIERGSEEMRRTWLPEIAAGRCWPTIAVTDPEQGSHVLGMATTARRSRRDYILEGEKVLVGNAALGDVHCVVARTGKPDGGRHSLTAFLVEKGTPGLAIDPQPVNGLRGFSVDTLRMTGVRVPKTSIIGEVGEGFDIAQLASVVYGRLNLAAVALGVHQRLLDVTADRVSTRKRYRGTLSDLDTVRHRIAEMQRGLMHAELAAYHAAHLLDLGTSCDPWLYDAKLTAHRAGADSSEHAKQLWGGHAAHVGSPIEQFRRDFDLIHAPAGTDDLQLKRLAEAVLGPHHPQWSARHAARRRAT
jgi:alkylation response protein AidB-like acyl-CoA dehydrogenase